MIFTIEELEDIYQTYMAYGSTNDSFVLKKINTQYSYCHICDHLISNLEFNKHFDDHFDDFEEIEF